MSEIDVINSGYLPDIDEIIIYSYISEDECKSNECESSECESNNSLSYTLSDSDSELDEEEDLENGKKLYLDEDCYICYEKTTNKSDCGCKSYIHIDCLATYIIRNNTNKCSICKQIIKVDDILKNKVNNNNPRSSLPTSMPLSNNINYGYIEIYQRNSFIHSLGNYCYNIFKIFICIFIFLICVIAMSYM
jgi:hypothetical protein